MTTSEKLTQKLTEVLSGEPWYGTNIYTLIERVNFEAAYEKTGPNSHTIAQLLLHMIAWTEEVIDRLNGKFASNPTSGDWPDPGAPDEQKWQNYVDDLKLVNVNLIAAINAFAPDEWDESIKDDRGYTPVTYAELVYGLIEHQIYHIGQVAILNKIING